VRYVFSLAPNEEWRWPCLDNANVVFASASSRGAAARIAIRIERAGGAIQEQDRVTLSAPHSWWAGAQQPLCEDLFKNDVLVIQAEAGVDTIDVRVDLLGH